MKSLFPILSLAVLLSCDSERTEKETTDIEMQAPQNAGNDEKHATEECYMRVTGRDTLLLSIKYSGDNITGTMEFDNFEKDSSHGTVSGKNENGNLVLWYSFDAEGMHSYSQQVLKPVPGGLALATGDIEIRHDTAAFKDVNNLTFPEGNILKSVDCKSEAF